MNIERYVGARNGTKIFWVEDEFLPSRLKYKNGRKDGNKLGKRRAKQRVSEAVFDQATGALYIPKSRALKVKKELEKE